ncbi:hypothetical protein DS833_06515 [Lactobacillus bombicola]|nr:hypothetical protein DS833_06515 [Lactobacillus bombicola]
MKKPLCCAVPAAEVDDKIAQGNINCILLGLQVRYMGNEFKQKVKGKNIGLAVIDMQAYGLMDGYKVLAQAYQIIGE